jgi:hypothetical protein
VEAAGLNEEEMSLVIKRFKTALKGHKEHPNKNKSRGKRSCFKCGKSGHFIAQCPNNDNDQAQEKKGKKERKKNYRKAKGEAHIGKECPTPMMRELLPLPSTSPPSSPTSVTHVSWLRRRRFMHPGAQIGLLTVDAKTT